MVVIGADLHKRSHTLVAVDETGRKVAEKQVSATRPGHLEVRRWAAQWPERSFALEDCRHLSRSLERDLLIAGERVIRVPPKLMAGARRSTREPGKSDPIDALAVARAALREPDLPVATLDGPERDVRLLVDHRDDLVRTRTQDQNRLRWHLHELMLDEEPGPRSLDRAEVLSGLERRLADEPGTVARLARDLVARIRELTTTIHGLEREIDRLVETLSPRLLALQGCGSLTAAKLVGEAAGIERFRSKAAFARHNGSAPIPVWSGNVVRHRLSRAATASSTWPSTGLPSPRCSGPDRGAITSTIAGLRATPRPRRSAPFAGGSVMKSSAGCATTRSLRQPGENTSPRPLDIGATYDPALRDPIGGRSPDPDVVRPRAHRLRGRPRLHRPVARGHPAGLVLRRRPVRLHAGGRTPRRHRLALSSCVCSRVRSSAATTS